MNDERRPKAPSESATTTASVPHDLVSLRYGLTAVYIRDTDPLSIARRRSRRGRPLTAEQRHTYEAWLAEQRQDAS